MTEVKVEILVGGRVGAPVASVSATEMTVVEGHTVKMVCQASGKVVSRLRLQTLLPVSLAHLISLLPSRFPSSCHHLVQAPSAVALETHSR